MKTPAINTLIHYAREFTCQSEMSNQIIGAAELELKELQRRAGATSQDCGCVRGTQECKHHPGVEFLKEIGAI